MIETIRQGLQADGITVSISKLCRWFEVPRRSVYYRPVKAAPTLQGHFVAPIKAMIEENPSFGYRTVAHLLGFNKNTVQRIFQLKGWQVLKRPVGFRPRIQSLPSVAKAPNERWATDMCRVWAGRDGWTTMALVIDCHSRELLGWHLSRSGKSKTAESALERASARWAEYLSRSCCVQTMAWSSPAAASPRWSEAMGCARSSSRRTAPSRTAWSRG